MRRGPRSTAPFVGSAGADAWERGDGGVENVRRGLGFGGVGIGEWGRMDAEGMDGGWGV